MRYVKFKIETDEEITGNVGIVPNIHRHWQGYIPTQSRGLAHDLLEHSTRERGNFDEELAALGSMLFVRDFGAFRQVTVFSMEYSLAWDIINAWRDDNTLHNSPKYFLTKADHAKIQIVLDKMRPHVIDAYKSEFEYDLEEDDTTPFESEEVWNRLCDWIRYGFMRAKRRFKNDAGLAYMLFERIERVIEREWDNLMQYADTGREFTLILDYDNGWAQLAE